MWTHARRRKITSITDYINSLYPTIKFEFVKSYETLNVLDLTLTLENGFISTDVYSKPIDSHLYLPFNSSHPFYCKQSVPYGVALRLKRNCSSQEALNQRCVEYKQYLRNRGYPSLLIDNKFNKALKINRSDLLVTKPKTKKKVIPLVLDFNPRLPDISKMSSTFVFAQHTTITKHFSIKSN